LLWLHLALVAGQSPYLCGDWQQLVAGKCGLSISCCTVGSTNPDGTVVCATPLSVDKTTTIISQDNYQYASNGQYQETLMISTGNTCPLSYSQGGIVFVVDTYGTYTDLGVNGGVSGGWHKVTYTPQSVVTTITKNNQVSFYTSGVLTSPTPSNPAALVSPCMLMTDYFNDVNVGCPCNATGTWASGGGIVSGATTTASSRNITATYAAHCPLVNLTNGTNVSSCPENYFLNFSPKYGNALVNTTNSTRTLEISQPVLNQSAGWSDTNIFASFTANLTCPASTTGGPTGRSSAGRVDVFPHFFAVWLILATVH